MKPSVKELFEQYRNNLYAAAFNVCGNAEDAEDVVQDTFIQYYLPESVNHLGEIFSENLKILCLWRYVFLQCFHPIVKKYLESYNPKTLAVIRFLAHFHLLGSRIQVIFNGIVCAFMVR